MSSKRGSKVKKKTEKLRFVDEKFAVVKFRECDDVTKLLSKLFECIPELWFTDEEKTHCYWPPKSKKSITLRAMNLDLPEDDWEIFECEVVREGLGNILNVLSTLSVFIAHATILTL